MKITIKNADFSSVKIGEAIDIPEAIVPAITSLGLTDDAQIDALVTMYNSLDTAGYWDRIEKLYLPCLASALNKTHVNIKDGAVDWVPGTKYTLVSGVGINGLSNSGDGDTYIAYQRKAKDITSFAMSFSNEEIAGTHTGNILGLRSDVDNNYKRMFTPSMAFNTQNSAVKLQAVFNSISSSNISVGNKNNQLVAVGHTSDKNYFFAGMGIYEPKEATYAPTDVESEKLTYYSNNSANLEVNLSVPISVSGIMDSINSTEYAELNTIFGTFKNSL